MSLADPDAPGYRALDLSDGLVFTTDVTNLDSSGVIASAKWAWRYWMDLDLSSVPPPAVGDVFPFDGMTATWVKAYTECSTGALCITPGDTDVTGSDPVVALRQYVRRTTLREHGGTNVVHNCPHGTRKFGRFPLPTTHCVGLTCDGPGNVPPSGIPTAPPPPPAEQTQPRTILAIESTASSLTLLAPLYAPKDVTTSFDPAVVALLMDPNNILVTASDGPDWWSGDVFGTVMNARTTQALIDLEATGSVIHARGAEGTQCNPVTQICLDPIVALSGRYEELVVFGETPDSVRVRHVDTGLEERRALKDGTIVGPVAATYRAEDDAYYVIANVAGDSLDMIRLDRDATVHNVAVCHDVGDATEFALTTGWDGSLVLSDWSTKEHAVAVLAFRPGSTTPAVVRVVRGKDPLALEAHSVFHGTYIARLVAGVPQDPEWLPAETLGAGPAVKVGKGPDGVEHAEHADDSFKCIPIHEGKSDHGKRH